MTIELVRLDDRLIHGQVVVGWGNALGIECIVLVDDEISHSKWEQDIYGMGIPGNMNLVFATVAEARTRMSEFRDAKYKIAVLLRSVKDAVRLCDGVDAIRSVNVGGLHMSEGRRERLPYVYLTDEEASMLHGLAERGVAVSAQDVPSAAPVPAADFL